MDPRGRWHGSEDRPGGACGRRRRAGVACGLALLPALLLACAGTARVEPAPAGDSASCRELVAGLPDVVAGAARRGAEDAAGVAAWGDPAVTLRCGTDPIGPTTRSCVTVEGVDWVVLATDPEGAALFATFGRDPGVEVEVPAGYGQATGALVPLADAVGSLPTTGRECE